MTMSGLRRYLDWMSETPAGGAQTHREILYGFYNHSWFLRKTWDLRKAQQSAIDYGIKALLRMAGGNESRKRTPADGSVVFAVGLGGFNTRTGLPTKHAAFLKKFIIKAKGLGHTVVGCHEYYTSAKCPRDNCHQFLENAQEYRSKYCRHCQAYFDRDVVGSENIANVCRYHLQHHHRPAEFMPA
ncbi:hypothetical protein EDD11_006177 [Mortierella claussenii]|nr:hypothetical protein EDD11_006177 [Mortierella claussenii]